MCHSLFRNERWDGNILVHTANQMRIKNMKGMVTVYSCKVLRTRYVKTGYFFDTNTKEL